ncbi:MAG TPA: iron-containing alcohol dehydrogenase [Candidatus Goldiibacteriota bacterium]|nr:iron-containing alcohol dehydrogenase [Candidatus Goldiibacteriota bacterium]
MKQRHLKKIPQQQSCGIFSFPGRIISGCGASGSALSEIEGKAAFVCGPYVNRRYGSLLRNAGITGIKFGGECSPGNYHRLKTEVREGGFKTLIALGGGKVMDTAKYVKKSLPEIKLINIIHTLAECQ